MLELAVTTLLSIGLINATQFPEPSQWESPKPGTPLAEWLRSFEKATGLQVRADSWPADKPIRLPKENRTAWQSVEALAKELEANIQLQNRGRRIRLTPGQIQPSDTAGPFRLALSRVGSSHDFETNRTFTDLDFQLHWEPRLAVVRVNAHPKIGQVKLANAEPVTVFEQHGLSYPEGATASATTRLLGLPRSAQKIDRLEAEFTVTAAESRLVFEIPLQKLPQTVTRQGVRLSVSRLEKVGNLYEVELNLDYPADTPEFDSFESFILDNKAVLVSESAQPNAKGPSRKELDATDSESVSSGTGRRIRATYRFPAEAQGELKLRYTTPGPLKEYPVRFQFENIPLP